MRILQTVKYYHPSKGGMESVVKNIVEGIQGVTDEHLFTVYANSHFPTIKKTINFDNGVQIFKERTPFSLKSQPLNVTYGSLKELIMNNDIIHHHYPFPNMEMALLRNISLLKSKRLIITWHANIRNSRWSWISRFYDPIIEKLLQLSDFIVVTSPQLLESSAVLRKYQYKVKVIPLSFDPIFSSAPQGKQLGVGAKKLLFVGKLRKYKGLDFLVDAIKSLNVVLTIVGDGEEEQSLRTQIENNKLGSKVIFLKNIDNYQLAEIYKDSDLFVLPSINEAEAFGVVQLEALANGLPVVNTYLNSGVPYVSLHGKTGLTVSPKSVDKLKGAIESIINNPDMYRDFSLNSIERAKLFTRETMSKAYLDLYINDN